MIHGDHYYPNLVIMFDGSLLLAGGKRLHKGSFKDGRGATNAAFNSRKQKEYVASLDPKGSMAMLTYPG
jgi:hypothetical protein